MIRNINKNKVVITFFNCIFLIAMSCFSTEIRAKIDSENDKVSKAIGHLITYQTKSKMDLSYGMNSPLKEVMKTYHADIADLPKEEQAMFFFMVDTNINVHGGSELFVFYNFVYLACGAEYIRFLKKNSNNPYFKPKMINLLLGTIQEREPQLKFQAKIKGISFNEYLKELKSDYGFK